MPALKLKVCGMKDPENVAQVAALRPDFMGFIFYPLSPRFAGKLSPDTLRAIPSSVKKVGVFVNPTLELITSTANVYSLDAVQLHGDEPPAFARQVKALGLMVIKAMGVLDQLPPNLISYADAVDCFLFDRATPQRGGSGLTFDWSLLSDYRLDTPFLLGGGVDLQNVVALRETIKTPSLLGIDVNSRFETYPGYKDVKKLESLIRLL